MDKGIINWIVDDSLITVSGYGYAEETNVTMSLAGYMYNLLCDNKYGTAQ